MDIREVYNIVSYRPTAKTQASLYLLNSSCAFNFNNDGDDDDDRGGNVVDCLLPDDKSIKR